MQFSFKIHAGFSKYDKFDSEYLIHPWNYVASCFLYNKHYLYKF